jgi:hypothetical protein
VAVAEEIMDRTPITFKLWVERVAEEMEVGKAAEMVQLERQILVVAVAVLHIAIGFGDPTEDLA